MFLIVAPVILFHAFVSQRLVKELAPHVGHLIVAICVVFTAYVSSASFYQVIGLSNAPKLLENLSLFHFNTAINYM